jgi:hypothetical protein
LKVPVPRVEALGGDVSAVVGAGEAFPPALALAREAMSTYDLATPRQEFVREYVETIRHVVSGGSVSKPVPTG